MSIRKELEKLIVEVAVDNGHDLTEEEVRRAANGVQYWFDESVYDSIDTAISDVLADRKPYVKVSFFMNGDESGQLYHTSFDSAEEYDEWYEDMKKSIDLFDEKF